MSKNKERRKSRVNKNKKKIREKKLLSSWVNGVKFFFFFLVMAGLTAISVYFSAQAMEGMLHSKIFSLNRVSVVGNERIPLSEIEARVRSLLSPGTSIFDVDLERLRREIEGIDWIKHVIVRRSFPDVLEIRIKEHKPVAVLKRPQGSYLVDENGEVFKKVNEGEGYSYPAVVGIYEPDVLKRIKTFIVGYSDIMKSRVTQIVFESDGVLVEDENGRKIKLERIDDYGKLKILKKVEEKLMDRVKDSRFMDLRFDKRIIVGF